MKSDLFNDAHLCDTRVNQSVSLCACIAARDQPRAVGRSHVGTMIDLSCHRHDGRDVLVAAEGGQ